MTTTPKPAPSADAVIYQCMATDDDPANKDVWMDVNRAAFEVMAKRDDCRSRIVRLATIPAAEPVAYVFPEDIKALRNVPEHRAVLHAFPDVDPRGNPMVPLFASPQPARETEDLLSAATELLDVFDQQRLVAQRIVVGGPSDSELRKRGNAAMDSLRASVAALRARCQP